MDTVQLAVELTRQFIQIPSESSDPILTDSSAPEASMEKQLLDFAGKVGLPAFSLPVTANRNNVIIEWKGNGPRVLVAGHMDTVSARGMDAPFAAEHDNDRIRGRGACDDKGPLACALSVLSWMKAENLEPAFDLTFAATVDEECTLAGAEKLADWINSFDLCVALEPTELRVVCAHKGDLRLSIRTTGREAHSSAPERGINAIDKMLPVIEALQRFRKILTELPTHPLCGNATLSFTSLHAGSSSNIIPGDCALTVDVRLQPDVDPEQIYQELCRVLPEEVIVDRLFAGSGMESDFSNPLIQKLSAIIRDSGVEPGPDGAAYATDCSRLAARGPCVVWGPGSISQAHKRDEYIEIKQMAIAVAILKKFFCGQ